MANMNISVTEPILDWVEAQVASGNYESADDNVCDLIRRDRVQVEMRETLKNALILGEESGISSRRVPEILNSLKAKGSRYPD